MAAMSAIVSVSLSPAEAAAVFVDISVGRIGCRPRVAASRKLADVAYHGGDGAVALTVDEAEAAFCDVLWRRKLCRTRRRALNALAEPLVEHGRLPGVACQWASTELA